MLKKSLLGILCLILIWTGAACASSGEPVKDINGLDLSFQTTAETEIHVSEVLKERKMVLIHFFQTSGRASKLCLPALEASYEKWKDQAEVIGVSCDNMDTADDLNEFAEEYSLSFSLVAADKTILPDLFDLTSVPTTAVIDRFGAVALVMADIISDPASYDRVFEYFCSDQYTQSEWFTALPPVRVSVSGPSDDTLTSLLTHDERIRVSRVEGSYIWPFLPNEEGGVRSSNSGVDDSFSALSAFVSAPEESVFSFRYFVSGERLYDALIVKLDGKEIRVLSGDTGWQKDALKMSAGDHEITFYYVKDEEETQGTDVAMLADFVLLEGNEAQLALKELPVYPVSSQTMMTLSDQNAQKVWVDDPSNVLIRDFGGPVIIYLLEQTEANINLTLSSQYDPWTVYLKADNSMTIQEILPHKTETGYSLKVPCDPERFSLFTAFSVRPYDQRILCNILIFPNMDSLENWFSYMNYVRMAKLVWTVGMDDEDVTYLWQVKVQDTAGNPVPGCEVLFSNKEATARVITNEMGIAVFESAEESYRVRLTRIPREYLNPSSREVVMPSTGGITGFILVRK